MPWPGHITLFLVFVAAMFRPAAAVAFSSAPQARVGAFELVAATFVGHASGATQLSSRLFRVPWDAGKLISFLEVDVAGLGARQVAPNIWLIEGDAGLSIGGRVVRSGATLP